MKTTTSPPIFPHVMAVLALAALMLPCVARAAPELKPDSFWPDWDAAAPDRPSQPAPAEEPEKVEESTDRPNPSEPANATDATAEPPGEAGPSETPAPADEPRLQFSFRFQPWSEVLNWFAEQAGYSLVLDAPPPGTFNYTDAREYTPAEAIDLLNSVLVTKGYNLVLRDRMLLLINLEDPVPPSLLSEVPADKLESRGTFELLSTRFPLRNLSVEEALEEIEELLGPQGSAVPLPNSHQVIVTESGGRLRTIRDVLEQAERLRDPAEHELQWFELHSVTPDEVVALLRQMFEIPEDGNAMADGSLRFATDPVGLRLLAAGKPDRLKQVARMLETIDRPAFGEQVGGGPQAAPQVEVYSLAPADPESVLKVMQTLLADSPGARLSLDPRTDNLIAMARPSEHATIRATLDQLQRDVQGVEVIRLRVVEPHIAVLAIGKLFTEEGGKPPVVDADPARRQLLVRGSAAQIAQIRSLLEKMGESRGMGNSLSGGKLRLVPVEAGSTADLIERLQALWPNLQENELRVVPMQRGDGGQWIDERTPVPPERVEPAPLEASVPAPPHDVPGPPVERAGPELPLPDMPTTEDEAPVPLPPAELNEPPSPPELRPTTNPPPLNEPAEDERVQPAGQPAKPAIFAIPSAEGLYISSDDTDALDRLETLIDVLAGRADAGETKLTVFYLRHAQAASVAERLTQLLAESFSPGGGGSETDDAAVASGILGAGGAVSGVGRLTLSGPVSITPEARLNALLVQAAPPDVRLLEQMLTVLDRPGSPEEVPAEPRPRLIPVVHTTATEIAEVLREVYQDRLVTGSGGAGGRGGRMSPEQMMEMFRRGRDRGRDGGGAGGGDASRSTETQARMSIGVDVRTNAVVVAAPEPLFEEVRSLVQTLDQAASEENQTVQVLSLRNSNPETVREALGTILGDSLQYDAGSGAQRSAGGTRPTYQTRTSTRGTTRPTTSQRSRGR